MLPELVSTIFTYLNAGGYYKSALEIQNAINTAQIQLYKKLRGNLAEYAPLRPKAPINFEETTVTADSLSELYRVYNNPFSSNIFTVTSTDGRAIDLVQSLQIRYSANSPFYPVNIVPDNQYLTMLDNQILYPTNPVGDVKRPLGRMNGLLSFEVYPSTFFSYQARVLTLPTMVQFTLVDNGVDEVPELAPGYIDTDFTIEKLNNLLYLSLNGLGFNLSNGVLIQASAQKEFKEL